MLKLNQCVVPSWDPDKNSASPRLNPAAQSNSNSLPIDVPTLDYEVAELTWENGQLAMHGLGLPRVPSKSTLAGGTLESIVNQATTLPHRKPAVGGGGDGDSVGGGDKLATWFSIPKSASHGSATMTMDALVPCTNNGPGGGGGSALVGSCSAAAFRRGGGVGAPNEWSGRSTENSMSNSATWESRRQLTVDTGEKELGIVGYTSTSMDSLGNTSSAKRCTKTADDHDSVSDDRPQAEASEEGKKKGSRKSSVGTKRSRAAAIHNQSERKRRDKINQRMKTLQKMIPNSNKADKASMLDEVIEYMKQLQAQIQMMSRMNMPQLMLPLAMQQQLQMSMMAPMGMGMAGLGMGMGVMDINSLGRQNYPGIPPVLHPNAFMPMPSWDGGGDRLPAPASSAVPDPLAAFLACQSQPMAMDAYGRMASLYQQFQQPAGPPPNSKS